MTKYTDRYGGGPPLPRKVIREGNESNQIKVVEVYLFKLDIVFSNKKGLPDISTQSTIYVSKYTTLNTILRRICEVRGYKSRSIRLWSYESETDCTLLIDLDKSIFEEALTYGQTLLFEKQIKIGTWPRDKRNKRKKSLVSKCISCLKSETSDTSQKSSLVQNDENRTRQITQAYQRGRCGLRNLGNTCFMNSSLQCLSNTPPLRDYFISNEFKQDINKANPIGMKGNIAEQFGNVIKALWSGEDSYISPRLLKQSIAKWAPQFEGYNQHDSQELLAFLLDGLHEDLNKISKKPFVETKEADGREDEKVAHEAWEGHLLRNKSIIVDLFHGQLKSTVTCPHCSKVSITFDPFMYLSLPLAQESEINIETYVMKHQGNTVPTKKLFRVAKNGFISEIRNQIAKYTKTQGTNIILAEIYKNTITRIFDDTDLIYEINNLRELYAYQLSGIEPENRSIIYLYHRSIVGIKHRYFGFPLVIDVPKYATAKNIYKRVWDIVYRYCCLFEDSDDEESSNQEMSEPEDEEDIKRPLQKPPPLSIHGIDHFPFKLTIIKMNGNYWGSHGYPVPYDDNSVRFPKKKFTLAIDWRSTVVKKNISEDEFDNFVVEKDDKAKSKNKSRNLDIRECLAFFSTNERLGPSDPWYCSNCKEHRRAWKKFDIWKLPKILVIHLKRFQFTQHSRSKLNYLVDFPIEGLVLDDFVINPKFKGVKYDLFAVSNHSGGLSGGHYTAYAKNSLDGDWYSFNDSNVSKIRNAESIVSSSVYTLFYQLTE